MNKNKKIAVILFNLGGPDKQSSIKPFLFNFFMDKNIIRAQIFVRYFLAKMTSIRRSKYEAGSSYGELGGKSPLLENSQSQAQALEKLLNTKKADQEFKTFVCMRYWHPMADEVMAEVQKYNPDEVVLLPLYPQYSTTTTKSSFQEWGKSTIKLNFDRPTVKICCYPFDDGFIEASALNVVEVYNKALKENGEKPRILFSAHGLPEEIIKDGDPYQWQCEKSAEKIASRVSKMLNIANLDWQICYQSRVGRLKWIGPSTEEALTKAVTDKVGVVILPHAFTQEHVETLVEIEIEYRELAEEINVPYFYRVPTVGTAPAFIKGLCDLVLNNMGSNYITSIEHSLLNPDRLEECSIRE